MENLWKVVSSAEKYSVHNSVDGSLIGEVSIAYPAEIDAAVNAAREAFERGPWSTYNSAQHAATMNRFADLLDAHAEEIAKAETQAMGTLKDSCSTQVLGFIETGKSEAQLLVGDERKGDKIFLNPGEDSTIYKEEILGPVLTLLTFETEVETIKLANDTSYGLSG
ncbi:hypothetical protein ACEQ8H_000599 [Pleosporales sp. CAS-2024a]